MVFVDKSDNLRVLDRQGVDSPLQMSPYLGHLGSCLVFLDEAHTRGIDLKLPENYRAAVTLGPNLSKDRLVQGESPGSSFLLLLFDRRRFLTTFCSLLVQHV